MEFSLLHAGLAAGAGLAAVPLILHLLMRQTPRHVIFPALRLIQARHKQSKKRLRIKNWLLLIARMALLALMALALARPTLTTDTPLGDSEVDTAIALVVDTSLSMEYTERGKDRLQEAKARAAEILNRATDGSEVFVIDSASPAREIPISPALALKRVEALTLRDANKPLNAAVSLAYEEVGASKLARREIYVLSDLAKSAWDLGSTTVAEAAKKANTPKPTISAYVLRLAPKEIEDVAVVEVELAATAAVQGEKLEVKAKLRSWGPKTTRVVELRIDDVPKDKRGPLEIPASGEVEVAFTTPTTLAPGLHRGEIRLGGQTDFLPFDDSRYFTFLVQPSQKVLIVTDDQADSFETSRALAPFSDTLAPGAPQLVKVDAISAEEFGRRGRSILKDYSAVYLLNVARPSEADWKALTGYVREGGGLVVALGARSEPTSYNGKAAAPLLPAQLETIKPKGANTFFARADLAHPLFLRFPREIDAEFSRIPAYRAWNVKPQDSRTLLSFTDGSPALLERTFQGPKAGHVLLWTLPLRVNPVAGAGWSELPRSWGFLEAVLQSVAYLSGTAADRLNYEAGEDAVLPVDPNRRSATYQVVGPDPKYNESIALPPTSEKLVVANPQVRGQWKVEGKARDGTPVLLGFSVNPPESETIVAPLAESELVTVFGAKENVRLAQDAEGLIREQRNGRVGFELFPWLMALILLLVTLENLLANKFHRERTEAPTAAAHTPAHAAA